jgi:hypothetical protein
VHSVVDWLETIGTPSTSSLARRSWFDREVCVMTRMSGLVATATLVSLMAGNSLMAQQLTAVSLPLAERIASGDVAAFVEAANSGNQAHVTHLQRALKNPRVGFSWVLASALAKLDDPAMQHVVWCRSIGEYDTSSAGQYAWIGGWYSVRALSAILSGVAEENFARAVKRQPITDVMPISPYMDALDSLPLLFKDGPYLGRLTNTRPEDYPSVAATWQRWIRDHESELRQLSPRGAHVELTKEACRNPTPR